MTFYEWIFLFHKNICLNGDTIRRIDIVSRCFENKNNNCYETKIFKNAICLLFTNLQIHFWLLCGLDVLAAGWPDYGFVNNKQMTFLKSFVSQQLFFYFQNIWIQCWMWRILGPVGTDLWRNTEKFIWSQGFLYKVAPP